MSNRLSFDFYSVLKNEDAPPFVGKNFLVAADGLGGAGSNVHVIDRSKHPDLKKEIMDAAYGDFDESEKNAIIDYLNTLVEPMADEKSDTSALWASRIIIGRFVYAMMKGAAPAKESDSEEQKLTKLDVSNEAHRAALSTFISNGLTKVAESLSLKNGEYSGQLLLPSTLSAICFEERESSVVAECVWAGDSRCYALCPSGLKLLSEDNEDSSGAITNLFAASIEKTVLHYRRYEIEKPCALMVVSDGIFDPFAEDYIGVEYYFQDAISKSGSLEELSAMLKAQYDSIRGDDSTVAFTAFGFKDYEDMKQALKPRADYFFDLTQRWQQLRSALELVDLPESEVSGYIATRTSDKYEKIAQLISDALIEKKEDAAISPALRDKVMAASLEFEKKEAEKRKKLDKDFFEKALKILCLEPAEVKNCLRGGAFLSRGDLTEKYNELMNRLGEATRQEKDTKKCEERIAWVNAEYASICEEITRKIEYCNSKINEISLEPRTPKNDNVWKRLIRHSVFWREMEYAFLHNTRIFSPKKFLSSNLLLASSRLENDKSLTGDPLVNRIVNFYAKKESADALKREIKQKGNSSYERYCEILAQLLVDIELSDNHKSFFTEEFIERIGAGAPAAVTTSGGLRGVVLAILASEKNFIISDIVKALAANYDKTSVIDSMYHPSRLTRFREYYKYKNSSADEIISLKGELSKIEEEYSSMLKSDVH